MPSVLKALVKGLTTTVIFPIETFGRVYMQGDGWHTDAAGYDAIGHALARAIGR